MRAIPTLILALVAAVLALPVLALLGSWTQWDAATAQILGEMARTVLPLYLGTTVGLALMVGVGTVSILHGKGTGALKEEIRRYLRTVPEVESARDEHADRGGAGITIVTFDLS